MSTHKMPRTHTHLHTQIHFTHRMSACTCTHILTHICTVSHPAPHCKRAVCSPVGGKYCVRVHTHTHTLTRSQSHTHTHIRTECHPAPHRSRAVWSPVGAAVCEEAGRRKGQLRSHGWRAACDVDAGRPTGRKVGIIY